MGTDSDLFLEPLPEYLTCQVCMNALSGCHSWCSQDHLTCRRCIHELQSRQRHDLRCPQCRMKAKPKECVAISRIVGELQMRCKYSVRGACEWTGNVSDSAEHFAKCDSRPTRCENSGEGCDFVGTDSELEEHLDTECEHARMTCPREGCQTEYVRSFSEIHDQVCTHFRCRVEGCQTITKQAHLPRHEVDCEIRAEKSRFYENLLLDARETINELAGELETYRQAEGNEEEIALTRSGGRKRVKRDDEFVQPPWARLSFDA